MSLHELLQGRDDIDEKDISTIMQRAEQLQLRSKNNNGEGMEDDFEYERPQIEEVYVKEALKEFQQHRLQSDDENSESPIPQEDTEANITVEEELAFWQRPLSNKEIGTAFSIVGVLFIMITTLSVSDLMIPGIHPVPSATEQRTGEEQSAEKTESTVAEKTPVFEKQIDAETEQALIEELFDTGFDEKEEPEEAPTRSQHLLDLEESLQGEWILMSSYFWDKGKYNVTEETKQYREREYLNFSQGRYSRVMDQGLYFSGDFVADDPIVLPKSISILKEAKVFLLHSMNVSSSISGFKKNHDFYHAELRDDQLVLFYLGTRLSSLETPLRGYRYHRKGYVYRRR